MSETLEDLEQRLGDGTVAKIAELLGLSPPKPLPIPKVSDRDFIVLSLFKANENLLRECEHLRQVVLALAEATGFLPQLGRPADHHATLRLVADFCWERDQHGGGFKRNSFTLVEHDCYRERWREHKPESLERKYFDVLKNPQIKRIVEERGEPYEELIRIFALKPTDEITS